MIMNLENIKTVIDEHKREIVLYGVRKLGLFGSVVRGQGQQDSDIDFLVDFEEGKKNFDNFMDLSFFLEDLFHKKIDLVTPEALSDNLKSEIYNEVSFIEIR